MTASVRSISERHSLSALSFSSDEFSYKKITAHVNGWPNMLICGILHHLCSEHVV
jgi:hypothetical protein